MKESFEQRMQRLDKLIDNTNKLTKLIQHIDGKSKDYRNDLGRRKVRSTDA